MARELFDAGILDRLTLKIHPVVAETGRRLFEPGHHTTPPGLDRPDHHTGRQRRRHLPQEELNNAGAR